LVVELCPDPLMETQWGPTSKGRASMGGSLLFRETGGRRGDGKGGGREFTLKSR